VTHNTLEVLGRLARFAVQAFCIAIATAAVAAIFLCCKVSLAISDGWAVTPDYVSRLDKSVRYRVASSPPPSMPAAELYVRGPKVTIMRPWTSDKGISYLDCPFGQVAGPLRLHTVPNPYSGYFRFSSDAAIYLWPEDTQMVLLDARSLLAVTANGDLANQAEGFWSPQAAKVPLPRLAEGRPLSYLLMTPLSQYEQGRNALRRAPPGAVPAAARKWALPAKPSEAAALAREIQGYLKRSVLVTEDPTLAREAVAGEVKNVILVGPHAPLPGPGVNVPDFEALVKYLDEH